MPNWCDNMLTLTHSDPAMITRAAESAERDSLLEEFAPLGEWQYDAAVEKWGTKWDISNPDIIEQSENMLQLSFNTAWSPPLNFYDELLAQGFEVNAQFYEPGVCYVGRYNDGDVEEFEIDPDDLSNIPEELKDQFDIEEWYSDEYE